MTSDENFRRENALKMSRNATKTPSKPLGRISTYQWGLKNRLHRSDQWRGLINKGATLYEGKRIGEAERKRRERKAKTNGPPADSVTLTCSTCNLQFRARIGLVSHQRTHLHMNLIHEIMTVFLISERRTTITVLVGLASQCHDGMYPSLPGYWPVSWEGESVSKCVLLKVTSQLADLDVTH